MAIDPYGNQAQPRRRGFGGGGIRWWVLLLFAGYAAYYWISNRVDDPLTGEKVLIDQSITPDDEKALGLQAWNELQQTEQVLPPTDPNAKAVKQIADRLIA
ncbi:MAG: M48 family peptidase, partial [Lysobacter sp.]|nr:M48 family peptidase [Lysobacter sp.]